MKYKGIKKLYYSISEISDMLGIKQSVIRYWETEFKELKPQKNRAGNRIYKKDDISILRMIHYYVHEKHLSIHEANDVITDLKKEGLYKRKLQELNKLEPVRLTPGDDEPEDADEDIDVTDDIDERDESDEPEEIDKAEETEDVLEETIDVPLAEPVAEEEDVVKIPIEQPSFEIVTPTQETFIYPLDDMDDNDSETDETRDEEPADQDEPENAKVEPAAPIHPEPAPQIQVEKDREQEAVQQQDPELRELLKKISQNIKDIIDILNE